MSDKKALKINPLSEDNEIMKNYFNPDKPAPEKKTIKPEKKKTRKEEKRVFSNLVEINHGDTKKIKTNTVTRVGGKPKSFDEPVEKLSFDLPQDLVMKLRMEAVQKKTRINKLVAEALGSYLK